MASIDGINFQSATKVQNGATSVRRDAAKVTVTRTGAIRSNTEGKELIAEHVRKVGGDPNNYQLTYKGAEEAGIMGLCFSQQGDLGIMNVRIYQNSVTFHAGGCFDEFPKLRPATDANGTPCLAIHVTAGSPSHAVKRSQKQAGQGA